MKKRICLAILASSLLFVGCGAPPLNPPMDSGVPLDNPSPDTPIVSDDRSTPVTDTPAPQDNGPATVCLATPEMTCSGADACQPNHYNPTCAGALACQCDLTPANMPASCRATDTMMRTCQAMMTCSPGRNHCSVDLPEGVDYAPFTFDADFFGNPMRNLRSYTEGGRSTSYSWYNDQTQDEHFDQSATSESTTGFRHVYIATPQSLREMISMGTIPTTCSGDACYWNRSNAMSQDGPSLEIRFQSTCQFTLTVYSVHGTLVQMPTRYTAQRPDC